MKYCPYCGNEVKENAEVCLSCGKLLEEKKVVTKEKKEKKKGILGLLAMIFGILAAVLGGLSILWLPCAFLAIPLAIAAFITGIIGFMERDRKNIVGLILGPLTIVGYIVLFIIGIGSLADTSFIRGEWNLDDNSAFLFYGDGETCYWYGDTNDYNDYYYQGTCTFENHLFVDDEVKDADNNTYVLTMKIENVKYDGEMYTGEEFTEMKTPYFEIYMYFNEDHDEGTFVNSYSKDVYQAIKK